MINKKLAFSMTFHDFPGPRQDSRTFQALENVLIKFHDFS